MLLAHHGSALYGSAKVDKSICNPKRYAARAQACLSDQQHQQQLLQQQQQQPGAARGVGVLCACVVVLESLLPAVTYAAAPPQQQQHGEGQQLQQAQQQKHSLLGKMQQLISGDKSGDARDGSLLGKHGTMKATCACSYVSMP